MGSDLAVLTSSCATLSTSDAESLWLGVPPLSIQSVGQQTGL